MGQRWERSTDTQRVHDHGLTVSRAASQGRLALPHSVAVDDCAMALYVADLEGRAIRRFSTQGADAGKLTGSWDVSAWGKPYSVESGPYGCVSPSHLCACMLNVIRF